MKLVYIAHPLFGDGSDAWGNPDVNVERYLAICAWASLREGVAVASWVHHHFMHKAGLLSEDAEFYLLRDERLIFACDELWICGPPAVSKGMQREIEFAKENGIKVRDRQGDFEFTSSYGIGIPLGTAP